MRTLGVDTETPSYENVYTATKSITFFTESQMVVSKVKVLKCSSDVTLSHYPGKLVAYHEWKHVYVGENGKQ